MNDEPIFNVSSKEKISEVKDRIFKILNTTSFEEDIYYEG